MKYFVKDNKKLPYKIIEKNNKNSYFRVKSDHLQVTKSKYNSLDEIYQVIENNFDKFYKKYQHINSQLESDSEILLENKNYKLIIIEDKKFRYEIVNNTVYAYSKFDPTKTKKEIYKRHIKKMYLKIEKDIEEVLKQNNIYKRKIIFKYYKSKFGSYHRFKDEISINIFLARLNINYLYYVLMHEYAHTKEFNHSKSFYNELSKLMPNYKHYDKSLKKIAIYD